MSPLRRRCHEDRAMKLLILSNEPILPACKSRLKRLDVFNLQQKGEDHEQYL